MCSRFLRLQTAAMLQPTRFDCVAFLCRCIFLLLLLRPPALAQNHSAIDPSIPIELIPADIEIRELVHIGDDSCRVAAPNEWMQKVQKALQLADSRGLVGDRAVL